MRVAYICADTGVPVFGRKGSSIHVQEVVRALIGQGAVVELFASRRGGDPPSDLADLPCFALPAPSNCDTQARERAAMAAGLGALDDVARADGELLELAHRFGGEEVADAGHVKTRP